MKSIAKSLLAGLVLLVAAPFAHADSVNQISFAGGDMYCTTTTSTCNAGDVQFRTPTATGNAITTAATGLFAAYNSSTPTFMNFNYLTTATPFTLFTAVNPANAVLTFIVQTMNYTLGTASGIQTLTVNGTGYYTNTANGSTSTITNGAFVLTSQGAGNTNVSFSDTNTITPEPSSLMLLGTGLVAAAALLFQRRRLATQM